ncbi:transglycosylase-like protein with SLT domain [Paraburkholderia unamae]|uniref:Transglycosylase-like protein with SLT domain n=2 Tax=Paraburkholderia unamae TaxID=219649 RepID=A0ABX5KSR9_9BURK|nr:transglycosylase-like protein with SLT domain [Paraburkholderia unamae]
MRRGRLAALIAMAAVCNPCVANSNLCWEQAGARYGVDPLLLYSIAQKESRLRNDAVNRNRNGTEDVCMMQINSTHFAQLAQWGITRERLLADPCICINVGAWVLSSNYSHYGVEWRRGIDWQGVGAYNAGTAENSAQQARRERYWRDVESIYRGYVGR